MLLSSSWEMPGLPWKTSAAPSAAGTWIRPIVRKRQPLPGPGTKPSSRLRPPAHAIARPVGGHRRRQQDASGPRDVVVCAAGSMPGDLHKLWRTRDHKGYHVEYGYSCMGYEIAGGLGVKMAAPDREVYRPGRRRLLSDDGAGTGDGRPGEASRSSSCWSRTMGSRPSGRSRSHWIAAIRHFLAVPEPRTGGSMGTTCRWISRPTRRALACCDAGQDRGELTAAWWSRVRSGASPRLHRDRSGYPCAGAASRGGTCR